MFTDLPKYKVLYLETAWEYLRNLQSSLWLLSKSENNQTAIKQVFLDAHSLKSQSLAMDYQNIGNFFEKVERIFRKASDDKSDIPDELLTTLLKSIENLKNCLNHIELVDKEIDLSKETKELEKYT